MESAGRLSAGKILELAPKAKTAVVLCGPGHNGGDGFVVARELAQKGLAVTSVELSSEKSSSLRTRKKSELKKPPQPADDFLKKPLKADLWIDALFGIGLTKNPEGTAARLVEIANSSSGAKIALDTPSGLDVNTGTAKVCFKARHTLTVGHPKPGFYLNEGPGHCGRIHMLDIGFPENITRHEARSVFLLQSSLVQRWIPRRKPTDNKTKGGRALILAGSSEMPGAAILACRAAKRVGAGYVYCSEREVLRYSPETIPYVSEPLSKFQSALIGPGLGTGEATRDFLMALKESSLPVVLDADAWTLAVKEKLGPFPANWLATPHAGELSRLLDVPAFEIESDRLRFAQAAQKQLGCAVLLKGFHSVIAFENFSVIIPTGNVALAKGGSGDVLGGMIAGFLSQGVSPDRAFCLGTYLHGKIADDWLRSGKESLSLAPSDLIEAIPESLLSLRQDLPWKFNS